MRRIVVETGVIINRPRQGQVLYETGPFYFVRWEDGSESFVYAWEASP